MKGTILYGPRDVRYEERDEPNILHPTDAIVRLAATCVCGSDIKASLCPEGPDEKTCFAPVALRNLRLNSSFAYTMLSLGVGMKFFPSSLFPKKEAI